MAIDFRVKIGPVWMLVRILKSGDEVPLTLVSNGDDQQGLIPLFTDLESAKLFLKELDPTKFKAEPAMLKSPGLAAEFLEDQKQRGVRYVQFDGYPAGIGQALTPLVTIEQVIESSRRMAD